MTRVALTVDSECQLCVGTGRRFGRADDGPEWWWDGKLCTCVKPESASVEEGTSEARRWLQCPEPEDQ